MGMVPRSKWRTQPYVRMALRQLYAFRRMVALGVAAGRVHEANVDSVADLVMMRFRVMEAVAEGDAPAADGLLRRIEALERALRVHAWGEEERDAEAEPKKPRASDEAEAEFGL